MGEYELKPAVNGTVTNISVRFSDTAFSEATSEGFHTIGFFNPSEGPISYQTQIDPHFFFPTPNPDDCPDCGCPREAHPMVVTEIVYRDLCEKCEARCRCFGSR